LEPDRNEFSFDEDHGGLVYVLDPDSIGTDDCVANANPSRASVPKDGPRVASGKCNGYSWPELIALSDQAYTARVEGG
jgi:hypothetical protein